jgi:hypothetical protein
LARPSHAGASLYVMLPPTGHVQIHKRLEDLSVIGDSQMQKLVRDYEILERRFFISEILGHRNDALRRAGSPFARHLLHAYDPRSYFESAGPMLDS